MKTKQNELRLLCRNRSVRLVYLFGSRQTEGRRYLFEGLKPRLQSSDLDIAVLVDRRNYRFFADAHKKIFADLLKIFEPFNPDLVILNEMDPLFQFDVICGMCIYAESEECQDEFEEKVMKFAEDLRFKSIELHRDFAQARSDGYFEIKLVKN